VKLYVRIRCINAAAGLGCPRRIAPDSSKSLSGQIFRALEAGFWEAGKLRILPHGARQALGRIAFVLCVPVMGPAFTRIIGIDPGLRRTGWGVIDSDGVRLSYVASGLVTSTADGDLAYRLREIFEGIASVIASFKPQEAAVEETFVNENARATLKLGQARGMALLAPAMGGLLVAEYTPNLVKKSVTGAGHAEKRQIEAMIGFLLPKARVESADEADALAIAICHANHRQTRVKLAAASRR
jgi:crossover junction endodeoxyribonuclease RuvC